MSAILERVRPVARAYFDERVSPAHDWHHVERVDALAWRLTDGRADVDETVLGLAVLLHDIGRGREDAGEIDDHATWGAREARRLLTDDASLGRGLSVEQVDAISHCIEAHRYSNDVDPETIEAKFLSDADNLDALGAIGLARAFSYGGEHGYTIHDPNLAAEDDDSSAGATSVNHVRKKLLDLPNRMYTERGRELADARCELLESFLEGLEAEVVGER